MSFVRPHIEEQLAAAITPREAEIVRARQVIMDALSSGESLSRDALVSGVVQDGGGRPGPGQLDHVELFDVIRHGAVLDADQITLRTERLRLAAEEALAAIVVDGGITPVVRPSPSGDLQLRVSDTAPGGGGHHGRRHGARNQAPTR